MATPTLTDAIVLATEAHRGQTDKGGSPYILHPLRVMAAMRTLLEMTVAVLHDVVEDTDWTLDLLRQEGYSPEVVEAVDALTRRNGETYAEFIQRVACNGIARRVKLADLADNMDVRRLTFIMPHDAERLERYRKAWVALSA